ncbi:uncharacterized protein LODBEIA_P08420 [Lodderomyces beijingensis]|uniref:Mitochondrial peculiar membrane protein 1 n=1 Tax=Lodderomyces beijingensis TaxID=1775926 RepID=A0ABP0ZGB3_9ASCO
MCGARKSSDDCSDNCRGTQSSSSHGDLDKYTENFDKIISNFGSLTGALIDVSMDAGRDLNEKAKEWSQNWFLHPKSHEDGDFFELNKENRNPGFKFPSFYETRASGDETPDSRLANFQDFWKNSTFLQNAHGRLGSTPFGYRAYKGPSIRQYHDCLDKDGKTVWDEQGYWRCLFPQSEVPVDLLDLKRKFLGTAIMTREDFDQRVKEVGETETKPVIDLKESGKFFNKFEDYLGWKRAEYQETEKRRQEEARLRKEERERAWKLARGNNAAAANTTATSDNTTKDRYVALSSVNSNLFTDEETNEVKLIETKKQCFNDGNCIFTKITKSKPVGSAEWVKVEEHTEDLPANKSGDNNGSDKNGSINNKGWFWK